MPQDRTALDSIRYMCGLILYVKSYYIPTTGQWRWRWRHDDDDLSICKFMQVNQADGRLWARTVRKHRYLTEQTLLTWRSSDSHMWWYDVWGLTCYSATHTTLYVYGCMPRRSTVIVAYRTNGMDPLFGCSQAIDRRMYMGNFSICCGVNNTVHALRRPQTSNLCVSKPRRWLLTVANNTLCGLADAGKIKSINWRPTSRWWGGAIDN